MRQILDCPLRAFTIEILKDNSRIGRLNSPIFALVVPFKFRTQNINGTVVINAHYHYLSMLRIKLLAVKSNIPCCKKINGKLGSRGICSVISID